MISDCFYYGVYSPKGFYSLASRNSFRAEKNYIVKSYSASAKQKLFDAVKNELEKRGQSFIDFCADERSLGVFSSDAGFRILDGTYGSCCIDGKTVCIGNSEPTAEMHKYITLRKDAEKRACRFLSACRCISNDMMRLDSANTDTVKINRYASCLWSSAGGILKGNIGTEHKRFVTCITSDGVELNMEAFDIYCENITVICDKTGASARRITDRVRRYALSAGYDVISCICPLNIEGGAEHIIIPELKCGIFTCKYFHQCDFPKSRRVSANRFLVPSPSETKKRMDFSLKAYRRLMQEVFSSLETVKYCDGMIEALCQNDFSEETDKIIQKLFLA